MSKWVGTWKGGRIARGRHDEPVFIIERMIKGTRYSVTLDVASEREADAELALFRRDPAGYKQEVAKRSNAVTLDPDLVARYLEALGEAGRSKDHRQDMRTCLADWAGRLGDRDLRRIEASELRAQAKSMPGKTHRIAAIKGYASFLRAEGLLLPADDPTLASRFPRANPSGRSARRGTRCGTSNGSTGNSMTKRSAMPS